MQENEKISIIIPVYNAQDYIEKAVKSALEQPETCEILLVEDNSEDGSLEICRKLEKRFRRVHVLQHRDKRNHGSGASRNVGIGNAKCPFISFLDADDYFLPGRFKLDMEILRKSEHIDGVYNAMGYHEDVEKGKKGEKGKKLTTVKKRINPEDLFENLSPIGKMGYFATGTLTVRKTIFRKTGLFDTTLRRSQDTHMYIRMAAVGRLRPGILDSPVAMRRVNKKEKNEKKELMIALRSCMFWKLFCWSQKTNVAKRRKFLLWDQFCYYRFIQKPPVGMRGSLAALYRLSAHALRDPMLLTCSSYYHRYLEVLTFVGKSLKEPKSVTTS